MTSVLQQTGQQLMGGQSKYNTSKNEIKINNEIESLIMAEVFKRQIRMKDFFYDFDRLRKGVVTEDKFRSALSMLHMHMTEKDINELIERYKAGPDLIQYTDFCEKVDKQFYDYGLAKNNLKSMESVSSITETEGQIIHQILLNIKQEIRTKRIMLKPPFQDFDRTKCSHITVDQFYRVLTNQGLLPPERYLNLFIRRYIDNGNPKEVNYVKFCDDVDNISEMLETVIKGISTNEKPVFDNTDQIVKDTSNLKIMSTLFSHKKLEEVHKDLQQIIEKIQAEVVMKRIRIKEFFKDFDKLRKGTVSQAQFERILRISGINISEKELQIILKHFKNDSLQNGLVRYSEFCEYVDEIFTTKNIDKNPQAQVKQFTSATTLPARRQYLPLSAEEESKLTILLQLYHKEIVNKRFLIKPHFEDFDITKQGYISKNQFLRILNQYKLFSNEEDMNLILKRYTDKGNLDEVNYYQFWKDVDLYDEGVEVSKTYADQFKNYKKPTEQFQPFIYNSQPNDLEDLLARLRKIVKEKRLRLTEFLRDFDKLRSGNITEQQMRLGMNMCQLPLSQAEFQLLVNNFRSETKPGHIRWRDLTDSIDEIFTVKNLEKNQATQQIVPPTTEYKYGRQPLTEAEIQLAQQLKERFAFFCMATRLDTKQFFQDWDRRGRNKVTPKQFRQVFATVNFPVSDKEFDAICRQYYCPEQVYIRYVDFINDTNIYQQNFPSELQKSEPYQSTEERRKPKDLNVIIDEIKNTVKVNRLRVEEYFKDYDPLRKGKVTLNKFRGVISELKIDLEENYLKILCDAYLCEDDQSKVNYSRFLSDINSVFTVPGLDKDPLVKPPQYHKKTFLDPNDILSDLEEESLHVLLTRLGEVCRKHRIMLKTYFQDKDRAKCGKVSFSRFRSILDFHKLPLTETQFKLLCKRFAYQGVEFNYIEFDKLLKEYEQPEI